MVHRVAHEDTIIIRSEIQTIDPVTNDCIQELDSGGFVFKDPLSSVRCVRLLHSVNLEQFESAVDKA